MGKSVIRIDPGHLASVLPLLAGAVKIEGTAEDEGGISLRISGECVPDAPSVMAVMNRAVSDKGAQFTLCFIPEVLPTQANGHDKRLDG